MWRIRNISAVGQRAQCNSVNITHEIDPPSSHSLFLLMSHMHSCKAGRRLLNGTRQDRQDEIPKKWSNA